MLNRTFIKYLPWPSVSWAVKPNRKKVGLPHVWLDDKDKGRSPVFPSHRIRCFVSSIYSSHLSFSLHLSTCSFCYLFIFVFWPILSSVFLKSSIIVLLLILPVCHFPHVDPHQYCKTVAFTVQQYLSQISFWNSVTGVLLLFSHWRTNRGLDL